MIEKIKKFLWGLMLPLIKTGVLFISVLLLLAGLNFVHPPMLTSILDIIGYEVTPIIIPPTPIIESIACNSNFNDNKWQIKYLEKDKENSQKFIYKSTKKGGAEMLYVEKSVSDNFHLKLSFKPVTQKQATLVVYVGDFYKLFLEYNNEEHDIFYIKQREEYIKESKAVLEKNILKNRIKPDENIILEIRQNTVEKYIPNTNTVRNVAVSFLYTPNEIENALPILDNGYIFQLTDKMNPDEVNREISVGLLYNKEDIIIEFYCFKLE